MQLILLVIAVCIDSFFVALSYGNHSIKLSFKMILLLSFICTLILGISIFFSTFISYFIPKTLCILISSILFISIGITDLFQSFIKSYLKNVNNKKLFFHTNEICFVLNIYMDETSADIDHSKDLSIHETIYLAFVLSFDSLLSGFAYGVSIPFSITLILLTFIFTCFSFLSGNLIGKNLLKSTFHFSWISGIIFIILGLIKLF